MPLDSVINVILILTPSLRGLNIGGGFYFGVLAGIALTLIDMSIGAFWWEAQGGLLSVLFKLATLIPSLSLGARRLHDINNSAWWSLMRLIVWLVIPMIILLIWVARRGDNGPNKYGLDHRIQP